MHAELAFSAESHLDTAAEKEDSRQEPGLTRMVATVVFQVQFAPTGHPLQLAEEGTRPSDGAAGGALPARCVHFAWGTQGTRMRLIGAPSARDAARCALAQLEGARATTLAACRALARLDAACSAPCAGSCALGDFKMTCLAELAARCTFARLKGARATTLAACRAVARLKGS
eukprot:6495860-Prymnesium_polylepis.6